MTETLREQQFAFARHLRDPARHPPPPGIEDRRMKVYRELFFNSLQSQLASDFPVVRQTLDREVWLQLVRDFYAEHRSQTPLFTEIAGEFVDYLQTRGEDPEWLAELAHYEGMETKLHLSDAQPPAHDPEADLLDEIPVLSPLAALAQEAGLPEDALIRAGQGMLEQLRRDGIVLGAAKNDQVASSSRLTAAM